MVRAVVGEADRAAFDKWYETEHLPDAVKTFDAKRAWRSWSTVDPSVHIAFYEFDDLGQIEAFQQGDGLKAMVAEFDRVWGDRVTRAREILNVVGACEGRG
jgi:hypothetical protein